MMPYRLIPLISALKDFHFFVTSAPFGLALNPPKIGNFRWYLINLISRVPKVPKTVKKTFTTPKVRFFQNIPCLIMSFFHCTLKVGRRQFSGKL